jgi:hypothetical protein
VARSLAMALVASRVRAMGSSGLFKRGLLGGGKGPHSNAKRRFVSRVALGSAHSA